MVSILKTSGLIGDPQRLLLDHGGHHHLSELLPLAVQRLAAGCRGTRSHLAHPTPFGGRLPPVPLG